MPKTTEVFTRQTTFESEFRQHSWESMEALYLFCTYAKNHFETKYKNEYLYISYNAFQYSKH